MPENPSLAEPALALRLEQARRWRAGDRTPAEDYLARHPELIASPEYALEVVYGELLLREEEGETPCAAEYLRRFPHFAAHVQRLFDVHTAVRSACLADASDAVTCVQDTASEVPGTAAPVASAGAGHEIREELGRGGMGVVFVCRDSPLGRDLAVKVLRPEHRGNRVAERRFLEEAQITGRLQHPGVVPVHQVGRLADGRPYFTMKLVKGQTLAALLAARAEPGQERPRFLAVFRQVCQTLAYAHDRGVVHRDLKPSNVMVGAFDEVQVMDWGLAKALAPKGESRSMNQEQFGSASSALLHSSSWYTTRTGTVLGTPAYMAPEQARGDLDCVDQRSDVFGLGAMLCEILTGQPPYGGLTLEEIFRHAQEGDLGGTRARLEGCGADPELVRLAQRCLAAEPAQRPRHAGEVARAVTAHLASVQERLRQAELGRAAAQARARAERKARRWTVLAATAAVALLLVGGAGALWWRQRAAAATERVTALLDQLDPLTRRGQWPEALAVAGQADALLATGGVPADLQRRVREQLADARMIVGLEDSELRLERKDGHYDSREVAAIYAQAFRDYGIDVEALDPAEAAERIRGRAIRDYLAVRLEQWARLNAAFAQKERLVAVAEEAAPEDRREELRAARRMEDREALQRLADAVDVGRQSPEALLQLSFALERDDYGSAALSLLRRAQQRYPADFAIASRVVNLFYREPSPPWDEVLRVHMVALALRSRNPAMHATLGSLLEKKGRLDEAIAAYRESIRLEPKFDPAYIDLGLALDRKELRDEAVAALEHAHRLKPDRADAPFHLGRVLVKLGRLDEAVAAFREAARLDPAWSAAHQQLGLALLRQHRSDEAQGAFQEAVRACGDDAVAHIGLGRSFYEEDRPVEAMASFRKAIQLQPDNAFAHGFLGIVLENTGRLDEGIAEYRESIRLKPDSAEIHPFLGTALRKKGEFAESLAEFRRGHELFLKTGAPAAELAQSVREAERLVELDARLPAILGGSAQPASPAERMELANLCLLKQLSTAAARFFEEALRAQPAMADDLKAAHRYNAACAAALAGCGLGHDVASLSEPARARWREQALAWLRADLAAWAKQLASGRPEARAEVRRMLEYWQRDSDLAGLRDAAALARLATAEQEACRQVWAEVQKMLGQAR
jgi:serine/threonine-protein kinase